MDTTEPDVVNARLARITTVQFLYSSGLLDRKDAEEVLNLPLIPGNDATIVDDRTLLDASQDDIFKVIKPAEGA